MSINVNNNVATAYATQQAGNQKTADRFITHSANLSNNDSPVHVTISAEGSTASNNARVNEWQSTDAMLRHFINVVRGDNCPRSFSSSGNNPSMTREEADTARFERAQARSNELAQFTPGSGNQNATPLRNNAPSQDQLQLAEMLGMNEAQHRQMANMITGQFNHLLSQHTAVDSDLGQRIFDQIFDSAQALLSQFHEVNQA
ncbi:MAG: hypothetical protein FWB87_04370 [Defluviitaleaceae bacterium]|nr:hypothetical protein [Defluviitaleaceae bacterium]